MSPAAVTLMTRLAIDDLAQGLPDTPNAMQLSAVVFKFIFKNDINAVSWKMPHRNGSNRSPRQPLGRGPPMRRCGRQFQGARSRLPR